MPGEDLQPAKFEHPTWEPGRYAASLDAVHAQVVSLAYEAIAWYLKAKRPKQRAAQALRLLAIVATTVAGIIPMLSQLYSQLKPVWASVAVVIGLAALGLDRYFGFSSAWMRFITAELAIRTVLHQFQLDWEAERLSWQDEGPAREQVQRALALAKTFVGQVDGIVQKETNEWIAEFQASLKRIEETVQQSAGPGATR